MRVIVTGGAGFIGANLCQALADVGIGEVVALDNLSTGSRNNLSRVRGVELIEGDILDVSLLAALCERTDAIVHLAARPSVPRSIADPMASHTVNVTGTANVLEAARAAGAAHVIVASSSSVYGSNPQLPKHEGLKPSPVSPYAATKLATEAYALAWQHSFALPTLAFRFFNVFGPLQSALHAYAAVVPAFVEAALAGRPLPIHGDGRQTRDFTFVGTLVAVLCDAIQRRVTYPEPVNLAFGTRTSLLELVDELEPLIGQPLEREHLPPRPGDVRDSQADNSVLRSLFPDVSPVPLGEALKQTVGWHVTSGSAGSRSGF